MKKPLWKFIDDKGTFLSEDANQINTLYLPLCNSSAIMSCVSPDLHGDLKTDFNSFLLQPVSRIDLNNLKSSRNFWLYINPEKIWSATGVSKDIRMTKSDEFKLEAGLLWQKITRKNRKIGLEAQITSFIPANNDPVEIMRVDITNISAKKIKFIPTAAIPIFARSADNLHDHRHVTSLLQRIRKQDYGVIVKPTFSFDESGHKKNNRAYFVFGIDSSSCPPEHIYPTQEAFCADNSDLENPSAVFNNLLPEKNLKHQGKEAMGALRFKERTLGKKEKFTYIIVMGIVEDEKTIKTIWKRFNTVNKINKSLVSTQQYWKKKSSEVSINTKSKDFDNWFRWVSVQPALRKIFGCSFLPDFDYGRGGRGWRDLWQDCLCLILTNPEETRSLLINNFKGVRIDGSNATIIGQRPGEFIADRNNISRVWMDHGIWPLVTTNLYIHQSSDLNILTKKTSYFRDMQLCRSQEKDYCWSPGYGKELKTEKKKNYYGTILEHIMVENLVQFFNVGPHNHIRLENADWNDGLDLAPRNGESVAFTAMYAKNLESIAELLENLKEKNIVVFKELAILLDTLFGKEINYSNVKQKQAQLSRYFQATKYEISGKTISIAAGDLMRDLKRKAEWIKEHIRRTEWLNQGFFNGYYDEACKRIEGKFGKEIHMTLTGQTFPIMSGVAGKEQIESIFKNASKYLRSPGFGGFCLNTDFKSEQLNLGRAFSFSYGEKENGSFFNHMSVMFAYGLYKRGLVREGFRVIDSIYRMAMDSVISKIYPCLPEYFNGEGRGMYSYLTGSASWLVLTMLTQVFGVRGEYGDLLIEPKLTKKQFADSNTISVTLSFSSRALEVKFINSKRLDFGKYSIKEVTLNKKVLIQGAKLSSFLIPRKKFLSLANQRHNIMEIKLG